MIAISPPGEYQRTKYEASLDLGYAIRVHTLCARLFRRLQRLYSAMILGGGLIAVGTASDGHPMWTLISGILVGILSILDALSGCGEKAAAHERAIHQYARLKAKSHNMTFEELDKAMDEIGTEDPDVLESFRLPAYNDNIRSAGRLEWLEKLSKWERFMRALV